MCKTNKNNYENIIKCSIQKNFRILILDFQNTKKIKEETSNVITM